jgi:hypothetical protein
MQSHLQARRMILLPALALALAACSSSSSSSVSHTASTAAPTASAAAASTTSAAAQITANWEAFFSGTAPARPQPSAVHVNVPDRVQILSRHHAEPPARAEKTPAPSLAGTAALAHPQTG